MSESSLARGMATRSSIIVSALLVLIAYGGAAQAAPYIYGTPPASVVAGHYYSFQPQAGDPTHATLTFNIRNMPGWAQFDHATGRIYGTPIAPGNLGTFSSIVITAKDSGGHVSLPAFSITVAPDTPPRIAGQPPLTVTAGSTYSFRPSASDADGDPLNFMVQNKPAWASFDARTGLLSGLPGATAVGSYPNIVISVSDGHATAALPAFSIAVMQAAGSNATVSWAIPTQNTDGSPLIDLAGFRLYYGGDPAQLNHQLTVANPGLSAYVITSLATGTWYFAVAAYNAAGIESAPSEVVSFAAP